MYAKFYVSYFEWHATPRFTASFEAKPQNLFLFDPKLSMSFPALCPLTASPGRFSGRDFSPLFRSRLKHSRAKLTVPFFFSFCCSLASNFSMMNACIPTGFTHEAA